MSDTFCGIYKLTTEQNWTDDAGNPVDLPEGTYHCHAVPTRPGWFKVYRKAGQTTMKAEGNRGLTI